MVPRHFPISCRPSAESFQYAAQSLETTVIICILKLLSIHNLQTAVLMQTDLSVRPATPQSPRELAEKCSECLCRTQSRWSVGNFDTMIC